MKSKGMRQKHKFNDVVDDIRKDTAQIRYPKRAAKQLQESFQQSEIDKQNFIRRIDLQRQPNIGPWNNTTDVFPEKKWHSERQSPYIPSPVAHECKPEELLTNPGVADMQCQKQTYEPTYCYNMDTDPALDLDMAVQIQEERFEFQFREIKKELAEENQVSAKS